MGLDSLEEFYVSTKVNIIGKVLDECNGNISKAAEKLKIDRSTLNYTIKKYRINAIAKSHSSTTEKGHPFIGQSNKVKIRLTEGGRK